MRYRCAIDGQALDDIDESIYITDIQENAPKLRTESVVNAKYSGTRITRRIRQSLSIKISFVIRERDVQRRQCVMQNILSWAKEGYLTINTRPEQRLHVTPETFPAVDSALRWWDTLTMEFVAYSFPFWQDEFPVNVRISGTTGSKSVFIPGDAWEENVAFVEVEVVNRGSSAMNVLTLTAGDTSFSFSSLNLPPGKTLYISYGDDRILRIISDGESALSKRNPESSDDLCMPIGARGNVSIDANQTVDAIYKIRGVYR